MSLFGGTTGQVLTKKSDADNDVEWTNQTGQGGVTGDTLPIGSIMPYTKATAPENWLLANGQEVSRTEYNHLFAVIGTIYGEGDGSTTFNLPNLCGKTVVGLDADDEDFNVIGKTLGEKTHKLTIEEMPSHTHKYTYAISSGNTEGSLSLGSEKAGTITGQYGNAITETGGSAEHNNIQPSTVQNYIIKVKQSAGVVATVVDNLESTSETDALSAKQGKVLNEKVMNTPKLIYSKITTEEDENGFDITNIRIEEGKQYRISVIGSFKSDSSINIFNLGAIFNDVIPSVKRTVVFGSELGQLANAYSTTEYLRILRGYIGYGSQSEVDFTYKGGYIRSIGKYSCTAEIIEKCVNSQITSMLGPYSGTLNKIHISTNDSNVKLQTGTLIKIFELP